jgi:predicted nucleic acid-binding protein
MKSRLYLETTIPSYLTWRPSRDLVIAGHQQITRDWWENRLGDFQVYISQLVLDEVGAGDPAAARERLRVLKSLPLLDITPEVMELTTGILASGIIPRKAATDAAHIAIAAVHSIDFLLTWNCAHIANAAMVKALASICRQHAWECPVICTPEELLGDWAVSRDPIVDEVRRTREREASKHAFDIKAILSAAKKRQRRSGHQVVSFVRKSQKLSA